MAGNSVTGADSNGGGEDMNDYEVDSDYEINTNRVSAKRFKRMNGKWKVLNSTRYFKKQWMEIFPWVEEDIEDPRIAICRACNKKIRANKMVLNMHQKTRRHLMNLSGCDEMDEDEDEKDDYSGPKIIFDSVHSLHDHPAHLSQQPFFDYHVNPNMEQVFCDDQFSFYTDSPVDSSQNNVTAVLDKLVEKYHEQRIQNLKIQHDIKQQVEREKERLKQQDKERALNRLLQKEAYNREIQAFRLQCLNKELELKKKLLSIELDAKLRVEEQELSFARLEYEKKVKLLGAQLLTDL